MSLVSPLNCISHYQMNLLISAVPTCRRAVTCMTSAAAIKNAGGKKKLEAVKGAGAAMLKHLLFREDLALLEAVMAQGVQAQVHTSRDE